MSGDLLLLTGQQIADLLRDREHDLVAAVRDAYVAHARGRTSVPHSLFLRFAERPGDRIIALAAHLGDGEAVAGVKWVSSFPDNVAAGLERASAVIVLNALEDGRATTLLEGSVINAKRTAACAALAGRVLHGADQPVRIGAIGCGRIQLEIVRFLLRTGPPVVSVDVFDVSRSHAEVFASAVELLGRPCRVLPDVNTVLRESPLVSFATTAVTPHVDRLASCPPGATILHMSLRDIAPEAIAACDNVADDVEHVCRESTSLDLAARQLGRRDFIRCGIGDVLTGDQPPRAPGAGPLVFSPFGLGILDLAAARLARRLAEERGVGMVVPGFHPPAWLQTEGKEP